MQEPKLVFKLHTWQQRSMNFTRNKSVNSKFCLILFLRIDSLVGFARSEMLTATSNENRSPHATVSKECKELKSKIVISHSLLSIPGCQEGQRSFPRRRGTPEQPAAADLHTPETPQHPHTAEPVTHTHTHTESTNCSPVFICFT